MDRPSLYDDDIVAWAEEQAAALRTLGARGELSNAVDWELVAEEIESVGRAQIDGVDSALRLVLIHVLKYLSAPNAQSTASWRVEVLAFGRAARKKYKPSMRQRIDWEDLWTAAVGEADAQLELFGDHLVGGLPRAMPFTPEELVSANFTMDWALERLSALLDTGAGHH
jgi:hypothetical protein